MIYDNDNATIIIENTNDYQKLLKEYSCNTIKQMQDKLWFEYGIAVEYPTVKTVKRLIAE